MMKFPLRKFALIIPFLFGYPFPRNVWFAFVFVFVFGRFISHVISKIVIGWLVVSI